MDYPSDLTLTSYVYNIDGVTVPFFPEFGSFSFVSTCTV